MMSVNPAFGGQSFIENTYAKVKKLKALFQRKNANILIEMDRGVTNKKSENPSQTSTDLKQLTSI